MSKKYKCINCGKPGHFYKYCLKPLTSYGLLCFRKNIKGDNYELIMVRRKYTIGFIEFLRGKYDINNYNYIKKLFNLMTIEEKMKIKNIMNFDKLRNSIDMNRINNYKKEYDNAKNKFKYLKDKDIVIKLINLSFNNWDYPEWGIPKGRRNYQDESDLDCAIREFSEETNIDINDLKIYKNILPLEEVYTGINNIKYKHVYYISILDDKTNNKYNNIEININNYNQFTEIGDINWYTENECRDLIRYYYFKKIKIINKAFQMINNKQFYFE